ncbi:hypothetical protein ATM17_30885 (plasmid) [Sphingopyxis macrogoltabida]|uniref:CoA transferase n=2 Tax=Sphingopyxis macrogoltabida TaxID=33050 RepID=A0AAC9FHK4_SPHMC|nr:putative acyl-CoA transferases/carnitine dehydratase [Sphingopyxis macrogoltabida]AMU92666.1 hypothetical protein ATM17_30885 [Sphingopyxis macrogoltabida]
MALAKTNAERVQMGEGILSGVRVVEIDGGQALSVAGLLLAEAGAEVIKVEADRGARGAASFAVWNRSKKSVHLDIGTAGGRASLDRLLRAADVLMTDWPADRQNRARLDEASLADLYPHLIHTAIGGWPANHRLANRPVDDTIVLAESGLMDEQRGVRDGPIYLRFPLGSWGAAYLAAIGVVSRLIQAGRGGGAGPVSTSLVQGALLPTAMLWRRAEFASSALVDSMNKEMRSPQFECGDGVWIHVKAPPDDAPLMRAALAGLGPNRIAELNRGWPSNHTCINWGANAHIFKTRPSAEWLADLWGADVPVQADVPMGAIYRDEQALANGYVVDVEDPELGKTRQPGVPCTVDPPMRVRSAAPGLGTTPITVWDDAPTPDRKWVDDSLPLAGVRIADFGSFVAGPLAPMILGDLGADVIKIEGTGGDVMRRVEGAFLGAHRGKRSLALDLKSPAAAKVVERLVRWADIVHHNIRMPAAWRIGLANDQVMAISPDVIFCHVSSYGPVGPRKDWPGYDQLFQAQSGWEYEGAGEGNPPMWHRFGMMDHQAGLASALSMLLALYHRDRTGQRQAAAGSLLGASVMTVSEMVMLDDGALSPVPRLDSRQMGVDPGRRLYAVKDGWVALVAEQDGALSRLCDLAGADHVAGLEESLADVDMESVIAMAAAAGGCAVVAHRDHCNAFFDDPDNRRLGLVQIYRHARLGRLELPGAFLHFGPRPAIGDLPPPDVGEHSRPVMSEIGVTAEEAEELIAAGAVHDGGHGAGAMVFRSTAV